ncbi:MAG: hypothetical protein ABOK23_10845 [Candidatus Methanoperedens sp.]|nr:hypothetical protein [Candidatus Methanoperedens sp.]MCZ7395960.1 hypothetical protein [Candidatus Methanoperedens sp.]
MENIEKKNHPGKADIHVHTRYSGFGSYSEKNFTVMEKVFKVAAEIGQDI